LFYTALFGGIVVSLVLLAFLFTEVLPPAKLALYTVVPRAASKAIARAPIDPNWKFPDFDSTEWKQATVGVSMDCWAVFGRARSAAQLKAISERLRLLKRCREEPRQ
jgi:hypothetical protein